MKNHDFTHQQYPYIKVMGIGDEGCNAVNIMFSNNILNVGFIVCHTNAKALEQSNVPNKILLDVPFIDGMGFDAEIGKMAAEGTIQEIRRILEINTVLVIIVGGIGGVGGGASIISQICRELNKLCVGIVSAPVPFEGAEHRQQVEVGIKQLLSKVNSLIVTNGQRLSGRLSDLDDVFAEKISCIIELIESNGHIHVDLADVCTVLRNGGMAMFAKAEAEGVYRADLAIQEALEDINNACNGAKWALLYVKCSEDEHETIFDDIHIIEARLRAHIGENTDIIMGVGYDNNLGKKISITLIVSGLEAERQIRWTLEGVDGEVGK